jgi:hypothetical protein
MTTQSLGRHFLNDALQTFRDHKKLAERAFAQLSDQEFFRTIDAESNSIAVNIKHMAGNMLSRWTDFLTTDGEKPDRQRDMEFVMLPETTRAEMLAYWEKGWQCVFDAIEPLTPDDLMRTVPFAVRITPSCRPSIASSRITPITWVRLCIWLNISNRVTADFERPEKQIGRVQCLPRREDERGQGERHEVTDFDEIEKKLIRKAQALIDGSVGA